MPRVGSPRGPVRARAAADEERIMAACSSIAEALAPSEACDWSAIFVVAF